MSMKIFDTSPDEQPQNPSLFSLNPMPMCFGFLAYVQLQLSNVLIQRAVFPEHYTRLTETNNTASETISVRYLKPDNWRKEAVMFY